MDYANFDLLVERAAQGYTARVLDAPAGQASVPFTLPPPDDPALSVNLAPGQAEETAGRTLGARLFQAVFSGGVGSCLGRSLDLAAARNQGLRLSLRLADVPELATLPWELLYDPARLGYLALSTRSPLVRYLELPEPCIPLPVQPPLQLLALLASPAGYPPLDLEGEWDRLRAELAPLVTRGLLVVERLGQPTLAELQERLRRGPCHILHFAGHGGFDPGSGDGLLLLAGRDGAAQAVTAGMLGTVLHDHEALRLVVLNACEGARGTQANAFAGSAQSLVRRGLPAVIAMQAEVAQDVASVFAGSFYGALADGYGVDAALAEARKTIFTGGEPLAWAAPVLYLRAADGRLWDLAPTAGDGASETALRPQAPGGQNADQADDWWNHGVVAEGGGDAIVVNVGAYAQNVAAGKNITVVTPSAAAGPSVQEGLAAVTAALKAQAGGLNPALLPMADFQLKLLGGELSKTAPGDRPSANAITQVGDWLCANLPQLQNALADLFTAPATRRVLQQAGDAAVRWAQDKFGS